VGRRAGGPEWKPGLAQRLRLAEAREAHRPEQALPWYMLVVDELLLETVRRPYARAIPVLKHALSVRRRGRRERWFAARLAELCEHHRPPDPFPCRSWPETALQSQKV
jgi:uncharacterized Zn finger protein